MHSQECAFAPVCMHACVAHACVHVGTLGSDCFHLLVMDREYCSISFEQQYDKDQATLVANELRYYNAATLVVLTVALSDGEPLSTFFDSCAPLRDLLVSMLGMQLAPLKGTG